MSQSAKCFFRFFDGYLSELSVLFDRLSSSIECDQSTSNDQTLIQSIDALISRETQTWPLLSQRLKEHQEKVKEIRAVQKEIQKVDGSIKEHIRFLVQKQKDLDALLESTKFVRKNIELSSKSKVSVTLR
jgi:hypothetical protein